MNLVAVVDVGNTGIKWGRCTSAGVQEVAYLDPLDEEQWRRQLQAWDIAAAEWAVAGSDPTRRDRHIAWLERTGQRCRLLASCTDLPLQLNVRQPERVGLDRLFNAVAVKQRKSSAAAAILIDAGTAVTVDFLDAAGVFQGGTIFPGLRLMTRALHEHTALLPEVRVGEVLRDPAVSLPGKVTEEAIALGVLLAVVGGIERIAADYKKQVVAPVETYLSGGDGPLLSRYLRLAPLEHWPAMTLEGIRHAALAR